MERLHGHVGEINSECSCGNYERICLVTCPRTDGEQCSIDVAPVSQKIGHIHLLMLWARKRQRDRRDILRLQRPGMAEDLQCSREAWGDVAPELLSVGWVHDSHGQHDDDVQATDRNYGKWKKGLMSGIGVTIVEKPLVRKETDELAGKFRFGKTILITDLVYKCNSNARGMTNIQYGLDEMGYAVTVIDINSFKSVTRAQEFLDAVDHLKRNVMPDVASEENVTIHVWISFAFLITDSHPYHVWVEGNFAERMAEAIRSVDKMATRPIFVSLCKDPRFHGIRSGIQDVAMNSADILRSYGIMVTTDDGMWRLMYGHAGNHYMNNHSMPDRLGVFATMEKFLFRQRVRLMCSLNVEAAKGLNDMVKASSMKVGINLELMETVLKEPSTIQIGAGDGSTRYCEHWIRLPRHCWRWKKSECGV